MLEESHRTIAGQYSVTSWAALSAASPSVRAIEDRRRWPSALARSAFHELPPRIAWIADKRLLGHGARQRCHRRLPTTD